MTSSNALVTIASIANVQQPVGGTACGSYQLSCSAEGAGIAYQWQELSGGSWLNVGTGSTYMAPETATYRCVLSNSCGTVTSNSANVTINPLPPIPQITGDSFIYAGQTATLTVPDDGYPDTFFWYGASGSGRTVTVQPTETTTYWVIRYRNGCWSYSSPGFTVTVGAGGASYLGYYDPAQSEVSLQYGDAARRGNRTYHLNRGAASTIVAGDWDGDGVASLGIYDPDTGTFSLWDGDPRGTRDHAVQIGNLSGPAWQPLVGDWNGDGIDTVGLYNARTGRVALRNSNRSGPPDLTYVLAFPINPGAGLVVAGDWTDKGYDTVGVYDKATSVFFLKDSHTTGRADHAIRFNAWKDGLLPLAGDWDWSQSSRVGLYDPETGEVRLRLTLTDGRPDYVRRVYSGAYDVQVFAGRWNAPQHAPGGRRRN